MSFLVLYVSHIYYIIILHLVPIIFFLQLMSLGYSDIIAALLVFALTSSLGFPGCQHLLLVTSRCLKFITLSIPRLFISSLHLLRSLLSVSDRTGHINFSAALLKPYGSR